MIADSERRVTAGAAVAREVLGPATTAEDLAIIPA
jgi:hypothetical protein